MAHRGRAIKQRDLNGGVDPNAEMVVPRRVFFAVSFSGGGLKSLPLPSSRVWRWNRQGVATAD